MNITTPPTFSENHPSFLSHNSKPSKLNTSTLFGQNFPITLTRTQSWCLTASNVHVAQILILQCRMPFPSIVHLKPTPVLLNFPLIFPVPHFLSISLHYHRCTEYSTSYHTKITTYIYFLFKNTKPLSVECIFYTFLFPRAQCSHKRTESNLVPD